jgi:hypothetical protein
MAREGALITTWGAPVRGREAKALEVFTEFLQFWGKRAAEGKVSEPEVYFAADGSHGMAVVRGRADVLNELWLEDESMRLIDKSQWIVEDLKTHLYLGGSQESIQDLMGMFAENGQQLGYM